MRVTRKVAAAFALLFIVGICTVPLQSAPGTQGSKQDPKAQARSSMPKEVLAVIQEGLATRQGRQDIPFSFSKHLILPAQGNNLYPIFFFKAKNADLGYVPSASGTGEMETTLNVFFQIFESKDNGTFKTVTGGKSMALLKTSGDGYDPEKEDWYSLGMGMPHGNFTLALVLCTPDMKKMSVGYHDITLPGPAAYEAVLLPTDPVIVTAMEQVEPDQRPTVHQGYFTWGAIKFVSNEDAEIEAGGNLEIAFFVLGAAYKDPAAPRPMNDIEVTFEVRDAEGNPAIKWAPQSYEAYFINQPLPLVQTLQTLEDGKVVKTEKKALPGGKYTLAIALEDKVSGKKADYQVPFSVK